MDAQDIDLIVLATSTPDQTFPATATWCRPTSALRHGMAFDVQAVCSGFVYALTTADAMLKARAGQGCALVIGSETFSRILDWTDRTTCVLFGDGAGAFVLTADAGCRVTRRHPGILQAAFRWPLQRQALCRWRAVHHQDGGPPAHGRQGSVQACRGQHRLGDAGGSG
jgi:3-oxoacyl-[acyl-carrier-protein] synthase-3